uniref:Splicing factor YJU2 n=1 Tax=Caenorhabditis tropicalis TaxID=1561998 RepID=A0A1I7T3E1_9PELO
MTGTERKVFQKYYPPDYDPSKIPRAKGQRNKQFVQRVMTPFNMQCNTCHEYIYKGKKFNMKRETAEGETYLGLKLFRFYFRCPNCLAEITFKTDLENCDYQNEHGATRLFEAVKLYQDQQKKADEQEAEDAKDPMKMLEKRTMQSRQEMDEMGNLEDLQESSRTKECVDTIGFLSSTDPHLAQAQRIKMLEEEDDRMAKELMGITSEGRIERRIKDDEEDDNDVDEKDIPGPSSSSMLKPSIPKLGMEDDANNRKRNQQKERFSGIKLVKKAKPSEPSTSSAAPSLAPSSSSATPGTQSAGSSGLSLLAGYGSDSDSD